MTPAAEEAPPIMVCTLFGVHVTDRAWLEHRMELISSITAPSLLAQEDQHFNWVVLVDDRLPDDIRRDLEGVVEPFGERALIEHNGRRTSWIRIARERGFSGGTPFLLTGRIDDDDAWNPSMTRQVREKVGSWLNRQDRAGGLTIEFPDGLEWVMYEMLDVDRLQRRGDRVTHPPAVRKWHAPIISMNYFVCAPLSYCATVMGLESAAVTREDVRADSETVTTKTPMWLCCRHKQCGSGVTKANGDEVEISMADLAAHFGLDKRATQRYLDQADERPYTIVKQLNDRKAALAQKLSDIERQIESSHASARERMHLRGRRDELRHAIGRLEADVTGDPEELDRKGTGA